MRIYTRRGDQGGTDLFGGQATTKDDLRVQTYGQVDELNAHLGLARSASTWREMDVILQMIQSQLFTLGADLATPLDSPHGGRVARISQSHIQWLEQMIDQRWTALPEMKSFILPGGSELASRLHVARTVCRRAERDAVALARSQDIGKQAVIYLNRLSDLLFTLARWANILDGVADVPWTSGQGDPG